jgi:hypothetical protein
MGKNLTQEFSSAHGLPAAAKPWYRLSRQWKTRLFTLAKWAVFFISLRYLYLYVWLDKSFLAIFSLAAERLHTFQGIALLSVCSLLLFINWGFEAVKWQRLVRRFHSISLYKSYMAILAGSSISLWMPNRAGEYIGRIFILKPKARIKGILATLIGSVSQLLITLILGIVGLVYYEYSRMDQHFLWPGLVLLGGIFVFLLLLFYFNINKIRHLLPQGPWLKPLRKYLLVYSLYSSDELSRVLLYSFYRYFVFSTQFYLLLLFFGVHVPVVEAFGLIFLMYLIQTVSPTNAFTELVVRGGVSVYLFKSYSSGPEAILAASYGIWLINIIIPGLIGAFVLLRARLNKKAAI